MCIFEHVDAALGTEVRRQSQFPRSSFDSSACFNVCTGDIGMYPTTEIDMLSLLTPRTEDAPAPAAIHSFKTTVVDGQIYVTADQRYTLKQNMKRYPRILTEDTSFQKGVIIVGGGCGAFHAVMSLREVWLTRIFGVVILGLNVV